MSARDDKIRRVVAELDIHVAEVEADIAVLKALLADDEAPGDEDLVKCQSRSLRLPSITLVPLALASSSRSQVQTRTASAAACLAWDRPSVGVRWRPPLAVAIVTHLVTQSFLRAQTASGSHS